MPHSLVEAEKFNIEYSKNSQDATISDKLRYFRFKNALLQREVADYLEIDRSTYLSYESGKKTAFPMDKLMLASQLFGVDIEDLLDDYNRFLYYNQGNQLRAYRMERGLTQKQLAEKIGVHVDSIKKWESNKATISQQTWSKLFNSKI